MSLDHSTTVRSSSLTARLVNNGSEGPEEGRFFRFFDAGARDCSTDRSAAGRSRERRAVEGRRFARVAVRRNLMPDLEPIVAPLRPSHEHVGFIGINKARPSSSLAFFREVLQRKPPTDGTWTPTKQLRDLSGRQTLLL